MPVTVADPAVNARTVLDQVRACHDDGVAVAVFPELALCGYAVDDLLLQDTLLDAVLEGLSMLVSGTADLTPVVVVGAPLVHGTRLLNCAVVVHRGPGAGRGAEVVPADLPRVLRAALVRPGRRPPGIDDPAARRGRPVGPRPALRRLRRAGSGAPRRGLRGHVGAGAAERRGSTRGRHGAGQPVRQPDHRRPGRGPPAAGPLGQRPVPGGVRLRGRRAGRVDDRPVVGRPDDGLRVRGAAGRERAVPGRAATQRRRRRPRPDPAGTAASGDLRRQPSGGRAPRAAHRALRAAAADGRHRAAPQGRPVPVRARRPRAAGARLLRGLQHPGLRARAAAAQPIGQARRS